MCSTSFQELQRRRGLRPGQRLLRRRVSFAALRQWHHGLGGASAGLGGSAAATAAVALRTPSPGNLLDDVGRYRCLVFFCVFVWCGGESIF